MSTNRETVLELFRKAAWEVDRKEFEALDLDAKISALGIDSVAMLEVIGFVEEELDIHLPDEKIARVQTLRDLTDVIMSVSSGGSNGSNTAHG